MCKSSKLLLLLAIAFWVMAACAPAPGTALPRGLKPSPTPVTFSKLPRRFQAAAEMPAGEFLLLSVYDDDYTCLDNLCGCAVSEASTFPVQFINGSLVINPYFIQGAPEGWETFLQPEPWANLRRVQHGIGFYASYSQWEAWSALFPSFPYDAGKSGITILGTNVAGDVYIRAQEGYAVLPAGSSIVSERPEQYDSECKVLHKYTLTNYGLIRDEDVSLGQTEGPS